MQFDTRLRLLIFNVGMILALAILFAVLGKDFYRMADLSTQEESVKLKAKTALKELSTNAQVPLATQDKKAMEGFLETFGADRDFVGASIVDANGQKFVDIGRVDFLETRSSMIPAGIITELDVDTIAGKAHVEIEGVMLGEVRVSYSVKRVHDAQNRFWFFMLAIIVAVVAGIVASVLFAKNIAGTIGGQTKILDRTANELNGSAADILAVAQQTESAANDEAAAVDETRNTMRTLLEASIQIAEAATSVAGSAELSAKASDVIAEHNATLNNQARRITDISETIRAIADKSDLLALNASLEGTKAGEAGRGFVLLGQELRRLAETILGAVREIQQLAQDIGEQAQGAVLATEQGQKHANQTLELSQRITLITQQQRTGTEQVSQSMDEIQRFTQHALTGSQQVRMTADSLVHSAKELGQVVEHTKAVVGVQSSQGRQNA